MLLNERRRPSGPWAYFVDAFWLLSEAESEWPTPAHLEDEHCYPAGSCEDQQDYDKEVGISLYDPIIDPDRVSPMNSLSWEQEHIGNADAPVSTDPKPAVVVIGMDGTGLELLFALQERFIALLSAGSATRPTMAPATNWPEWHPSSDRDLVDSDSVNDRYLPGFLMTPPLNVASWKFAATHEPSPFPISWAIVILDDDSQIESNCLRMAFLLSWSLERSVLSDVTQSWIDQWSLRLRKRKREIVGRLGGLADTRTLVIDNTGQKFKPTGWSASRGSAEPHFFHIEGHTFTNGIDGANQVSKPRKLYGQTSPVKRRPDEVWRETDTAMLDCFDTVRPWMNQSPIQLFTLGR